MDLRLSFCCGGLGMRSCYLLFDDNDLLDLFSLTTSTSHSFHDTSSKYLWSD